MLSPGYQDLQKAGVKDLHNMELIRACKYNKELLGEFLMENRDFIFSILQYYKGNIKELKLKFRVTEDELFQHACIGIITAIQDFNFDKGIKFTTYIVRPILWEVNQLLYRDTRPVRLSRGAIDLIKQMAELEEHLGYRPNEDEITSRLHISLERYREIAMFSDDIEYIDAYEYFDIADTSNQSYEEKIINQIYIEHLFKQQMFTAFEKEVMTLILKDSENNNSKIAGILNVYPMTISRTLSRIQKKIMQLDNNKQLEQAPKSTSKYDREIAVVLGEINERNHPLCIDDIVELLDVCGFETANYSTRILYYIRQKAIQLMKCAS